MSISHINRISNVGKFVACSPGECLSFNRYTFIYADNGSGKTTFCNILRSIKTGLPDYVTGRKSLGVEGEINISFNIGGRNITFANGAWSETLPNIEIFDETFVADNIYTTNGIGHDHKRNLYQVIVGEEGVRLAREYEQLDTQSRTLSEQLRHSEQSITRGLLPRVTFSDLANLENDADIDSKIETAGKNLSAVNEVDGMRNHALPTELRLPPITVGLEVLLKESVEGLAADVALRITAHLQSHKFGENGERWLAVGTQHVTDTCPFCAQDLGGSPLITDLTGYFSDSYKQLKTRIDTAEQEIEETLSDRVIAQLVAQIESNITIYEYWSRYCTLPELRIDHSHIESVLVAVRQASLSLLAQKKQAVMEPVPLSKDFNAAIELYTTIQQVVAQYNETIIAARAVIVSKKEQAGTADPTSAERALNLLLTAKDLFTGEIGTAYAAYKEIQTASQEISARKAAARAAVDAYTHDIVARYETRLNELLLAFNANFSVSGVSHDYRGTGSPRSSFQVVINDTEVALGDADTPLDRPSFKNTLSSGDRSVLALAFFWAQLELKGDLSHTIVVLDDPFTSQDWFRRTATAQKATRSRVAESVAQVILLSHDQDFLREAFNAFPQHTPPPLTVFALHRNGMRSVIFTAHDLLRGNRQAYENDIKAMLLYMNDGDGNAIDIARLIRPTLETYLKTTYSDSVNPTHELGPIIRDINGTNGTHPVFELVEELEELNIYSRRWHHGGDLAEAREVNVAELRGYIRRTLKIVGTL